MSKNLLNGKAFATAAEIGVQLEPELRRFQKAYADAVTLAIF